MSMPMPHREETIMLREEIERLRAEVAEVRAEAVRIERENIEGWKQATHCRERLTAAESSLAALRKRVEESATAIPVMQSGKIVLCDFSENAGPFLAAVARGEEKRFRLVVEG